MYNQNRMSGTICGRKSRLYFQKRRKKWENTIAVAHLSQWDWLFDIWFCYSLRYENLQKSLLESDWKFTQVLNKIFVILFVLFTAGVFGTAHILFQSQLRGLKLSETLGSGFSCNGNAVAYVAGSPAPLNGYGLGKSDLSEIPFQERPGPSISSSYTSSLGFTIQVNFIFIKLSFCVSSLTWTFFHVKIEKWASYSNLL